MPSNAESFIALYYQYTKFNEKGQDALTHKGYNSRIWIKISAQQGIDMSNDVYLQVQNSKL